jgi:hypothetical protein
MKISGQLHVLAALPPWEEPEIPLNRRRLDGPQSCLDQQGREKSLPTLGIEVQPTAKSQAAMIVREVIK